MRAGERRVCGMCAACVEGIERASKQAKQREDVEEERRHRKKEGIGNDQKKKVCARTHQRMWVPMGCKHSWRDPMHEKMGTHGM